MRLWLDEMISADVARQLRRRGYDVQGVQEAEHRWAWGLDDVEQLAAAVQQGRALVSYTIRDFVPIAQQSAEAQRLHLGILLIHTRTIPPHDIGGLIESLAQFLNTHQADDALRDFVRFLPRAQSTSPPTTT
jgi:predicted nuclease of predicted toxin-antitoxin system